MRVYRTAELFFEGMEDVPERMKMVPPAAIRYLFSPVGMRVEGHTSLDAWDSQETGVRDFGAVNLRRVYYQSEDVPL